MEPTQPNPAPDPNSEPKSCCSPSSGNSPCCRPGKKPLSIVNLILWAIVIYCAFSLVMEGYNRYRIASGSMTIVKQLSATASVVPVEQEWQPLTAGVQLDLGYATVTLPQGQPKEIGGLFNDMIVLIQMDNGLGLLINMPDIKNPNEPETEAQAKAPADPTGAPDDQQKTGEKKSFITFDKWRSVCLETPKNFMGYFSLSPKKLDETNQHLNYLKIKDNSLGQKGIFIFEAPAAQGILFGGSDKDPRVTCEVWSKDQPLHQSITLLRTDQPIQPQDLELAKPMIASLVYKKGLPADAKELAALCSTAARQLPGYKAIQVRVNLPKEELEKLQQRQPSGAIIGPQEQPSLPQLPIQPTPAAEKQP